MTTIIKTNHQWRNFEYRHNVPSKVLREQFDWLEDPDGYFRYRGYWYHLSEFEYTEIIPGFSGIKMDSFYSGVVIKLSRDCEQYKVGTLLS